MKRRYASQSDYKSGHSCAFFTSHFIANFEARLVGAKGLVIWGAVSSEYSEGGLSSSDEWSMVQVLLIQRGKAPQKGFWSFPGGSLELGEATLSMMY